jgi:(S)-3,5-dihydroxyphenylglycine transaminase
MNIHLKRCFSNPLLNVMNFLNEVTRDYPSAISFATGSPMETFFDVETSISAIECFVDDLATNTNQPPVKVRNDLGQYNRTNGIINNLIARHLAIDENIHVQPESIMVTSGCQEAMAILMMGLFEVPTDVLLVSDPTYIGITGLASILGVQVVPVPVNEDGLDVNAVNTALDKIRQSGKRPRALYEIPDFNNPLGTVMPLSTRYELLKLAQMNDLLIIEDNPYGMFSYDGNRMPTLKSLDLNNSVIYLGTFSKTVFPGLRMGYLVANQRTDNQQRFLAEELSKIKGFTTVNTSPILQAAVGGLLINSNCSLIPLIESKIPFYKANRDRMVARLSEEFTSDGLREQVKWNCPSGGFFMTVTLPFEFDIQSFHTCASEYGLLCCPVSFFTVGNLGNNQIRLSFSYVNAEQIDEGVKRLGRFVRNRIREQPTS